jgi:hypothetical protein
MPLFLPKRNKGVLLLFFIYPFAAFLFALKDVNRKYSFTVILLFNILFGYTFIAQNLTADSYSYIEGFNNYINIKNPYANDITDYLTFNSHIKDIYVISSYYIISRISDNYHILMAFWAFVFSFFFLKAFRFFINRPEFNNSLIAYILAFYFMFSNNIFNINGVRYWTAAWIALYVIFEIVVNRNYKFLLLSLITPLVHISYSIFVCILILYLISKRYRKLWIIVFVLSFFVSELSLKLVQNYEQLAPKVIQNLIWSYTEEFKLQSSIISFESLPLYSKILLSLPKYFLNVLMFLFIVNYKHLKNNIEAHSSYSFLLVWLSFSNFTMPIPSFGNRFLILSIPVFAYLSLIVYKSISPLKKFIYAIPFIYCYALIYWLRAMVTVTDPFLLVSIFPHIIIKNLF